MVLACSAIEADCAADIVYSEYKAVFPTSARDFVTLQHLRENADGSIAVFGCSIEDARCPPRSGSDLQFIHRCLLDIWLTGSCADMRGWAASC